LCVKRFRLWRVVEAVEHQVASRWRGDLEAASATRPCGIRVVGPGRRGLEAAAALEAEAVCSVELIGGRKRQRNDTASNGSVGDRRRGYQHNQTRRRGEQPSAAVGYRKGVGPGFSRGEAGEG